eukprot:1160820-Pelagomonas_calceolata.AAC.9
MAGNECADQFAKYQASLKDGNLTDTGLPSAGPGGNPFHNTIWLANLNLTLMYFHPATKH